MEFENCVGFYVCNLTAIIFEISLRSNTINAIHDKLLANIRSASVSKKYFAMGKFCSESWEKMVQTLSGVKLHIFEMHVKECKTSYCEYLLCHYMLCSWLITILYLCYETRGTRLCIG